MVQFFKPFSAFLLLVVLVNTGSAQYYYKDLIVTAQTASQRQQYKDNKVKGVTLSSFEANGQPSEGFQGQQDMTGDYSRITTHTRTEGTPESWIFANYTSTGWPSRIVDTSDTYNSVSEYKYDTRGQLLSITNTSTETDNHLKDVEQHIWQYDAKGKPTGMLKIKSTNDTTFIRLVQDEKGNIVEEHATRYKIDLPTIFYYYDTTGHLTDIVRYNKKAQRLLPDYLFEYEGDRLATMLIVPEGGSDYQKWYYEYNDKGLKVKETCYNKQKELVGRIEYNYKY
jgi:YD repeat-containing protein